MGQILVWCSLTAPCAQARLTAREIGAGLRLSCPHDGGAGVGSWRSLWDNSSPFSLSLCLSFLSFNHTQKHTDILGFSPATTPLFHILALWSVFFLP